MSPAQIFTGRPVWSDFTAASASTMACRPSCAVTGSGCRLLTACTNAATTSADYVQRTVTVQF